MGEKKYLITCWFCTFALTKKWSVYNFNGRFIWTVRDRITTKNPEKVINWHQWLVHMGSVIFRHFQNCCNRDGNTIFKYMNYVPIVVATDLEVHFSVLKKGVSQYFCLYSVCTSHWCLVMSFWLKVCIYSHTRGVKLGLGLGFMQTSQVLPHWLNQSFSFWTLSYTQRHCHVRIEKGPVQTVAIILEAHNFLEYHYML